MLAPGVQFDRFVLLEPAGEGAQAAVWKAIDPKRPWEALAIKFVPIPRSSPTEIATEVARMRREAQALRTLDHPSLVRCQGMFENYRYELLGVLLDWVDGQPLSAAHEDPRMTQEHRYWVLRHIAYALAYLHGAGLAHRDLKFANVILNKLFWESPPGAAYVKLVDLGVVAPFGNPHPLTEPGNIVGTAPYIAPEMVEARQSGERVATPLGDMFAFGVLGWYLLTGEHPTGLPPTATMWDYYQYYKHAQEGRAPFPARRIDGTWGSVLRRCLDLRYEERLSSGEQLVAALGSVTASVPPPAPPVASTRPSFAAPPASPHDTPWAPPLEPPSMFLSPPASARPSSARPSSARPSSHAPYLLPYGPSTSAPPLQRSVAPQSVSHVHVPQRTLMWLFAGFGVATGTGLLLLAALSRPWVPAPPRLGRSAPAVPSPPAPGVTPIPVTSTASSEPSPREPPPPSREEKTAAARPIVFPCDRAPVPCDETKETCIECPSGLTQVNRSCHEPLAGQDHWLLRVGDVIPQPSKTNPGMSFLERFPLGEVCLRVSGTKAWTCTPATDMPSGHETRLAVTTADLTTRGIDVLFRDAAWEPIHRHLGGRYSVRVGSKDGLIAGALCNGVRLEKLRGAFVSLVVYLDAP